MASSQLGMMGCPYIPRFTKVPQKGEQHIRLPALNLSLGQIQRVGAEVRSTEIKRCRGPRRLNVSAERFSSPKTGTVGTDRFKDGAAPGTYWDDSIAAGEEVAVSFNTGTKIVTVSCKVGENLLKVAERIGVMAPTHDFCFEGACCHCEMEVEGGAKEVGFRADPKESDLIRSCICPVPSGRQTLHVNIWSDDDAWG